MNAAQISQILEHRYLPELIPFSEEFIQPVMQEQRTSLILFTSNPNRDRIKPYFLEYEKAAHEMFSTTASKEDKLLFVVSGVSYGIQVRLAEVVGIREDELPALFVIRTKKDAMTEKWRYTGNDVEELTVEKVRGFINDFREGNVERVYKSERVLDKEPGPREVRRIVGKTWDKTVNDPKKEVFVAIISEFCRACRDLEETWAELAESTPNDLLIATYNIDQNEIPG